MNSQSHRLHVLALIAVGVAIGAMSSPLRADPPTYRAFNLGVLSGDQASRAHGLNDQGAVVGFSSHASTGNKAFVWPLVSLYGFSEFQMAQLASTAVANDINNAGVAVGRKTVSGSQIAHR